MAAATGIWSQNSPTANAVSDATGSGTTTSSSSATISANDFLSLLVTEMQNQDPTASNDPNAYINQLVQVNSLEQLISINQNLSTALGIKPATAAANLGNTAAPGAASSGTAGAKAAAANAGANPAVQPAATSTVKGNLSVPVDKPAAHRVAESLSGKAHAAGIGIPKL